MDIGDWVRIGDDLFGWGQIRGITRSLAHNDELLEEIYVRGFREQKFIDFSVPGRVSNFLLTLFTPSQEEHAQWQAAKDAAFLCPKCGEYYNEQECAYCKVHLCQAHGASVTVPNHQGDLETLPWICFECEPNLKPFRDLAAKVAARYQLVQLGSAHLIPDISGYRG